MHKVGHIVVQIGECNTILCTNRLANDDFVDIVELIPILIASGDERDEIN